MKYDFFSIRSGLQKAVRRCEVVDTLYACAELDLTGLGNSTFQNLLLMASEDIGLADPLVTRYVTQCYLNWQKEIKLAKLKASQSHQSLSARKELMKAGYVMAVAKKSRVVDYCHHMFEICVNPYYDLSDLISGLKQKNREKSLLVLRSLISAIYKQHGNKPNSYQCIWEVLLANAPNDQIRDVIADLQKSFQWIAPKIVTFNLIFACLLITENDYSLNPIQELPAEYLDKVTDLLYSPAYQVPCVRDYALDKHTAKGRSMKRGEKHFFEVGSFCVNLWYPELYKKILGCIEVGEAWQEPTPVNKTVGIDDLKLILVSTPKIKLKLKTNMAKVAVDKIDNS